MRQYFTLNTSQQAQDRIRLQRLENNWYRLLLQSQDWGLEHIRIHLADQYFTMINQYLQITLRQFDRMKENPEYYLQEMQNIISQLQNIYSLAQDYEESLTPLPEHLMSTLKTLRNNFLKLRKNFLKLRKNFTFAKYSFLTL
jgi:hypothetical protein